MDLSMDKRAINVLIVDDHLMVRERMKALLRERGNILVVGEASNGLQTKRTAAKDADASAYLKQDIPCEKPHSDDPKIRHRRTVVER